MTKRMKRVVDAFVNCIKHGEFSVDYADVLISDHSKYGWLNDALDYYEEQTAQFRAEEVEEATEE